MDQKHAWDRSVHAANAIAASRMQSLDTGWREMGRKKWRLQLGSARACNAKGRSLESHRGQVLK